MKFVKSLFGYLITSLLVIGLWGIFVNKLGLKGSYFAALFLVGPCWYINHYKNFIFHKNDDVFIDMALAIAIAAMAKSIFNIENFSLSYFIESLPTFYYLGLGAILGVIFSFFIKKYDIKE